VAEVALCIPSAICRVVEACSSTAPSMVLAPSARSIILSEMKLISRTVTLVACWIAAIWVEICSVARYVWFARVLTSVATTANPRPASPALAASIVALSASKLDCAAILEIKSTIEPICSVALFRSSMDWPYGRRRTRRIVRYHASASWPQRPTEAADRSPMPHSP